MFNLAAKLCISLLFVAIVNTEVHRFRSLKSESKLTRGKQKRGSHPCARALPKAQVGVGVGGRRLADGAKLEFGGRGSSLGDGWSEMDSESTLHVALSCRFVN